MDQRSEPKSNGQSALSLVYGAAACLAVWLFVLIPAQVGQPVTLFGAAPEGLAPDAMPRFVLLAIAIVAGFGAVSAFKAGSEAFVMPGLSVLLTCGASFLFAALLVPLGFVVASALTVVGLAIYLGGRHPVGLALGGLVVPIAIYLVFTRVLHIALPTGLAGF